MRQAGVVHMPRRVRVHGTWGMRLYHEARQDFRKAVGERPVQVPEPFAQAQQLHTLRRIADVRGTAVRVCVWCIVHGVCEYEMQFLFCAT